MWPNVFVIFLMQAAYNVICYKDKPRLGTALELLRTTQKIENQLQEVRQLLDFSMFNVQTEALHKLSLIYELV